MTWKCRTFSFDTRTPIIMGVLNVTPDSFSDGGQFATVEDAVAHAKDMIRAGANIIDVGGESTRPGSVEVSADEEIARVEPVICALAQAGICVSVDTRHAQVARAAVAAGASIINDVSGFRDAAMVEAACACDAGLVVVHMQGQPETMQDDPVYDDVVIEVRDYLADQARMLQEAGVDPDRICVDPGPGFGKTHKQTIELMRNLHEIARLGYPVMVAASRKSYVGYAYRIENPLDRDEASAQEALMACELGASIVRTHNVEETQKALQNLRPLVFLGMGSNVPLVAEPGEEREAKIAQLNMSIGNLCMIPDTQIVDISSFYESEPAYYLDQEPFVNCVVSLRTGVPPKELLDYLHAIENNLGRVRDIPNGPRTIDVDILDYQLYLADAPELMLPHPRILERDFVVKPLLELAPNHVLADGAHVATKALPEEERLGKAFKL